MSCMHIMLVAPARRRIGLDKVRVEVLRLPGPLTAF